MARARRSPLAGSGPLPARRKWRAIVLSTLLLAPAYWSILAGLVTLALEDRSEAPSAGPFIAFGLGLVPFVFVALAFLSEHPRAAGAVAWAMVLALVVGIPVSAVAADAVSGFVAGIGAGGAVALRSDVAHSTKARVLAVVAVTAYVFLMVRFAGDLVLILAPALPFTALGVADHLAERRSDRAGS